MQKTPEEPFNRRSDPKYVDQIMALRAQKMREVLMESTDVMSQAHELNVLRFAAQVVINPHDGIAVESWQAAQAEMFDYQQATQPQPPNQNEREDV